MLLSNHTATAYGSSGVWTYDQTVPLTETRDVGYFGCSSFDGPVRFVQMQSPRLDQLLVERI